MLMTFRSVLKALGGVHEVAKLCDVTSQSVCNWRARNEFPARHYPEIFDALREQKPPLDVDRRLFCGFKRRRPNAEAA